MSRVSNAINMVKLLNKNGPMKVKDLARELEVSERMIKTYKEDLEKGGFYISSKRGPDGGYYLDMPLELSFIGITKEEMDRQVSKITKAESKPLPSPKIEAKEKPDLTPVKTQKAEVVKEDPLIEKNKEEKPELDLNILTVAELRDLAKKKEIKGYSKMKKEELIENLK